MSAIVFMRNPYMEFPDDILNIRTQGRTSRNKYTLQLLEALIVLPLSVKRNKTFKKHRHKNFSCFGLFTV